MASLNNHQKPLADHEDEEESLMQAFHLAKSSFLPMVLRAAIELDLLEIISKSKNNEPLSVSEIASQLPTQNPDAPVLVERILRFLASHSILKCTLVADGEGNYRRLYSLTSVAKYLTRNEDGVSFAPYLVYLQAKHAIGLWYHLKDAVLEGGTAFFRAHGQHPFDYTDKADAPFNEIMYNNTSLIMKKLLAKYNGFESLKEVVDVGGGFGANLGMIVSKYPHIKGINFDLPLVIKDAPTIPGVYHVGGDMFTDVPKGEAIFLKWILHDWDDNKCLKILENCYNALPNNGKVIVVEQLVPEFPETDIVSKIVVELDLGMLLVSPGAKERTKKEYETLGVGCWICYRQVCLFYLWLLDNRIP